MGHLIHVVKRRNGAVGKSHSNGDNPGSSADKIGIWDWVFECYSSSGGEDSPIEWWITLQNLADLEFGENGVQWSGVRCLEMHRYTITQLLDIHDASEICNLAGATNIRCQDEEGFESLDVHLDVVARQWKIVWLNDVSRTRGI